MQLPKIPIIKSEVRNSVSCKDHDYCSSCRLHVGNNGRCEGCTPQHRARLYPEFTYCYQTCDTCTGFKVRVPALCCRSPHKDLVLDTLTKNPDDWNKPVFKFKKRKRIKYDRKAIMYFNYGSALKLAGPEGYVCEHEVVAVNMSHCMGMGGNFFSRDMHDFLRVPDETDIILTTMSIDDHLERAWEKNNYGDPEKYEAVGIKYWMPLAFSSYQGDARMHAYYQFLRTSRAIEFSSPHFYPGYYHRPGLRLDDLHLQAVEKIPQVIFNTQFFKGSKDNLRYYVANMMRWHKLCPPRVSFWMLGAASPMFIRNMRKVMPKRDLYFLSAKPLYLAVNGKRLTPNGGERKLPRSIEIDKLEWIHTNFNLFEQHVAEFS